MDVTSNDDTRQGGDAEPRSRRSFLDILLRVGTLGWMASVAYPVLRYLTPLPRKGPNGPLALSAEQLKTITRKAYVIVRSGVRRVIVFRDPHGQLQALSAKCTHEGCTVQYVAAESVIWCACHNGRYDLSGRVISGPPPRPLKRYSVGHDAQGKVIVTKVSS